MSPRDPEKRARKRRPEDVPAGASPTSDGAGAAPHVPPKRRRRRRRVGGLLGLGLDNTDGHKRVTSGDDFLLVGGSEETHGRMQDLVIRMNEALQRKGRRFTDLTRREFEDLARDTLR